MQNGSFLFNNFLADLRQLELQIIAADRNNESCPFFKLAPYFRLILYFSTFAESGEYYFRAPPPIMQL